MTIDPATHRKRLNVFTLLKLTAVKWVKDEAPMMGAALAYYSLFSIAPMLLVALVIAGFIFGADAARGELEHQLTGYFGADVAKSIQSLLTAVQKNTGGGVGAIIIATFTLLFGASSVFSQLKDALNRIWSVSEISRGGVKGFLLNRLLAIAMVMGVGVLLISSLLISTVLSRVSSYATEVLPISGSALQFMDLGITFLLLSVMFAIIFRYLPDIRIGWRSVILGAIFTSILFAIGKFLIGQYIARGGMAGGYGAASSVLVLLVWIYYSSMIFLFGAEFTHVYSRTHKLPAEPIEDDEESSSPATT